MPRWNRRRGIRSARFARIARLVRSARLAGLAASAALAGCVAGCVAGPKFVAPADPGAATYTADALPNLAASGTSPDSTLPQPQQWWSLLNAPRLDTAIRQALSANRSLDAARSTLAQAQAISGAAESGRYPHVDLDAIAGRQKYGAAFLGPDRLPPFSYFSIGPAVSYTFDIAGGVRRTIEQQRALTDYQQHQLTAAALSVSGNVAMQALALATARAQIDAAGR